MPEPDDFGLSPIATLSHVGDLTPAPTHQPFWNRWRDELVAQRPRLEPAGEPDPSDTTATHRFESVGSVRIGCSLLLPPRGVKTLGGVVTSHGYGGVTPLAESMRAWQNLATQGVAVLGIRVRGFAGSRLDGTAQEPADEAFGWIGRGFPRAPETPEDGLGWILPRAIADLACAARALRDWLSSRLEGAVPISVHGESFGGGLAIVACAQMPGDWAPVERLVIGLPTFGDWAWRLAHPSRMAFGSGAEVAAMLRSVDAVRAAETLRLCDAAIHAQRVNCPVLCKLALRDDVVPAPSAASVFNALGSDPGRKWRFIVPEGHTEPSLACARRHALFARCAADFLRPGADVRETMLRWEPYLTEGERGPRSEETPMTGEQASLFGAAGAAPDTVETVLVGAYQTAARTLDDLPYTAEWARLYGEVRDATGLREREVFHRLHNLRKAGRLPRLGRGSSTPPRINDEEERALAEMVTRAAGSLGQRDKLPFTPEFDHLVTRFNGATGRELSPHDVWRLVAKLAK